MKTEELRALFVRIRQRKVHATVIYEVGKEHPSLRRFHLQQSQKAIGRNRELYSTLQIGTTVPVRFNEFTGACNLLTLRKSADPMKQRKSEKEGLERQQLD